MPAPDDVLDPAELRHDVLETIREHLALFDVDPERVVEEAVFGVDLETDSLALETLAQELEDCYGLTIDAESAAGLTSIAATIDHVLAHAPRAADAR